MKHVTVFFGHTDTIDAMIKLKNFHDVTHAEMVTCRIWFNVLNDRRVPKVGLEFKIPILERHAARIFNETS